MQELGASVAFVVAITHYLWRSVVFNLSDFIVYVWLLPVVAQILLPLAMLCIFVVHKLLKSMSSREEVRSQKAKSLGTQSAGERA
jgi:hypothetical protein